MSDIDETILVNGRQFNLKLREIVNTDRPPRWIASVTVDGKEQMSEHNRASFTGFSEGHVRELAHRWMLKWRN